MENPIFTFPTHSILSMSNYFGQDVSCLWELLSLQRNDNDKKELISLILRDFLLLQLSKSEISHNASCLHNSCLNNWQKREEITLH